MLFIYSERLSHFIALSTVLLSSLAFGVPTKQGPTCEDFFVSINATGPIRQLPDASNLTDTASVVNYLGSLANSNAIFRNLTGSFNLSARYCEPEVYVKSRTSSIQLLVHGITYTKDYWSALGLPGYHPELYSWIDYASQNGFPTLSIDRPGNGASSHPDPTENQNILQASVINQLLVGLKSGTVVPGKKFTRAIYVGHSLGSRIGTLTAMRYPDSIDALILTGWGYNVSSTVSVSVVGRTLPAVLFDSNRFKGFSKGYLVTSSNAGRQIGLYGRNGSYDVGLANLDFETQGTVAIGELTGAMEEVPDYTGPVTVITGENDWVFCNANSTSLATCSSDGGDGSPVTRVRNQFPNTPDFEYFLAENVGHDINFHYLARESFAYAHEWLTKRGF